MNLKKILFPTDFSEASRPALDVAASLARDKDALLVVVHVQEPPVAYGSGKMYYVSDEPHGEQLQRMLLEVKPVDDKVKIEHRLLTGEPTAAIVELTSREPFDMIVMSTHGRTGIVRVLMGSVAEQIVREATCPVLTLAPQQKIATTCGR